MMKWTRTGKSVSPERTINFYSCAEQPKITIESRKRHIPHANGREGTWDFTSYWVLWNGKEVKELFSLSDAKEYAETLDDGFDW